MVIVRVLKRKDGAALVVGVVTAVLVVTFISQIIADLTQRISAWGSDSQYAGQNWRVAYLTPFVAFILGLAALEILIRIYIMLHDSMQK